MTDITEQLRERVLAAAVDKTPLCIRGGGTKDFYGNPPSGALLETAGHAGIVAYEPTELVVTVRAGTPLAELEAALDGNGQMLAFEPPHFSPLPRPLPHSPDPSPTRGEGRQAPLSAAVSPPASPARAAPRPARCATTCLA
jgi:FAD/FMN-containing dehydrogenase